MRRAEQLEMVDQTPEALRRRMGTSNIYKPEKVDAALRELLPVGQSQTRLRFSLLPMWTADCADEAHFGHLSRGARDHWNVGDP